MEEKVFPRPAVAGELESYVEARLHVDHKEWLELEKKMVQSVAQPYYLTLDPKTGELLERFEGATLASDQPFIDFLRTSREKAERVAWGDRFTPDR